MDSSLYFFISFLYFYLRRSLQAVLSCKAGQEIREMEKCVFLFLSCVICYRFDVVVVFWMNKRQKSLGETTGNSQNKGKRKLLDARVPAVLWPPPVSLSLSLSIYLSPVYAIKYIQSNGLGLFFTLLSCFFSRNANRKTIGKNNARRAGKEDDGLFFFHFGIDFGDAIYLYIICGERFAMNLYFVV